VILASLSKMEYFFPPCLLIDYYYFILFYFEIDATTTKRKILPYQDRTRAGLTLYNTKATYPENRTDAFVIREGRPEVFKYPGAGRWGFGLSSKSYSK
jgi:hypothetical protein